MKADLFSWRPANDDAPATVKPWKPVPLSHDQWPPNYRAVYAWRLRTLQQLKSNPGLVQGAKRYYADRPGEFILHWCDTYDPRKTNNKWIPFVFFSKQSEVISFFVDLQNSQESGLIEKCRDAGVTWLACAFSVHAFLFKKHYSIGWGSRKANLVDKLGDPDSIFEKMRLMLRRLPALFRPDGWSESKHAIYMKFVNPENGSTITGEAGDNIGRGGRKSIYFKDEAQPLNSKVLTPFGWREIGSLAVGDLICGPNSDWRQIIGINDCGEHGVYRLTYSDGTTSECSENHLTTVQQVWGKRLVKTLRTHEIAATYCYTSPGGQVQYRYRLPELKPVQFVPMHELPLHPYIVGSLIGDGSIASGCVPEARSRARTAIEAAGIAGCRAHEKFVPPEYKFASVESRLALLQGLMDTDGSASGGQITFHSCSERLADDVRFIVQSLGGIASKVCKPDHRGYRDMFVINFTLPQDMVPFRLSRKINAMKSRKHPVQKTIVNVEHVGKQTVRCISVDADDGLYITDGCSITHNSAHYERPELIEAALGDNTKVQVDISSVNGLGNPFHRRRKAGVEWSQGAIMPPGFTRVLTIDWRDHPEKTQQWYDERKAKYEREGLSHLFAQEVDRDYSAAISNTIIPKAWLTACIDAHLKLDIPATDTYCAGLDIADGGIDRNALVIRQGVICRHADEWGERDPGVSTRKTVVALRQFPRCRVMYDSIGVGSSVKSEYNRLVEEKLIDPSLYPFVAWNAGGSVIDPKYRVIPDDSESIRNEDMFHNIKAQAWWSVRVRVWKTWRMITEPGAAVYPADELVSLDSRMPLLYQLIDELAQPVKKDNAASLKMIVDKQPEGTKSPNLGDGFVMSYFPIEDKNISLVGSY